MSIDATGGLSHASAAPGKFETWLITLSKQKLIGLVLMFDYIVLTVLGLALPFIPGGRGVENGVVAALTVITLPTLIIYATQRQWAYTIPALESTVRQARALALSFLGAFVVVMGVYFVLNIDVMAYRRWMGGWALSGFALLMASRYLVAKIVARAANRGELARRAVVVGGGKACEDLLQRLEKTGERAIRILGLFDDRGDERSPEQVGRYRKIGTFDELERYCREQYVDLLIIALPQSAEDRILHLMRKLWVLPIDVRIAAHSSKLKLSKRAYSYIGDVPFLAVFDRPLSDWDSAIKAIFDRVIALIALVMLSPLMALVALAVRLESKGPALFKQPRFGFNNELIEVYKFRSMYTDRVDLHGAKQVTKDDPRVTKVGRIIRKTSIDELPQLFNVLIGNLSLVGPRPHAQHSKAESQLFQDVVDGYFARHRMKPGITGWAQINGWRGETDTREKIERRVEHDLYYIENWSLLLDLYILAMTPVSLLNTKNAY